MIKGWKNNPEWVRIMGERKAAHSSRVIANIQREMDVQERMYKEFTALQMQGMNASKAWLLVYGEKK